MATPAPPQFSELSADLGMLNLGRPQMLIMLGHDRRAHINQSLRVADQAIE
jgi:hypothetical protein